ncbi:hypothetical protein [Fluviispira vulneris]|uniref:hypothetical protein n=1 Tax=Fluviispira vulneris TaxID=2763012 RepID=UPI0016461CFE|nr:hypothetical protein [Fluviispira vulneris]
MKILKFALSLLAVFSQSYAVSLESTETKPFRFISSSAQGEKKFLLCVNKQNSFDYHWASNKDGSAAFVVGEVHHELSGDFVNKTPLVTDMFHVETSEAKNNYKLCPKDYYIQPADSNPIKLYQMLLIFKNNKYFIFPGHAAVNSSGDNDEIFYSFRG